MLQEANSKKSFDKIEHYADNDHFSLKSGGEISCDNKLKVNKRNSLNIKSKDIDDWFDN